MSAFPTYVTLLFSGYQFQNANVVVRSKVERGIPRTRRVQSDGMTEVSATMLFKTQADYNAFYEWFKSPAGGNAGAAWFDWTDCRTDSVRTARLVADKMGPVIPVDTGYAIVSQSCVIEYVDDLYATS